MYDLARGLRHALRRLAGTPAFTLTAILTLALGVGANVAVFAVVDGILLKPLPFAEPDRLVGLWHTWPGQGLGAANMSPALYFAYREGNRVFEDVGMWDNDSVTVTGLEQPERVEAMFVTGGTLTLLGVTPVLGRLFAAEDDAPGTPNTTILSHRYWRQRFGADPQVVGRTLTINGVPCAIIGVTPADLHFLDYEPAVYLPFRCDRSRVHVGNFSFQGVARLRPGATLADANADVARLIRVATETFPGIDYETLLQGGFGPLVRPLRVDVVGNVGEALWVLFGTVGLVLLIACANVANLLLVRAEGRQAEAAVRSALGATRGRLLGESLLEALVLAALGGAGGLALAAVAVRLLLRLQPEGLPRLDEMGIDGTVLLFAVGLSLLAAVVAALLPSVRSGAASVAGILAEGGRGSSAGRRRQRARNALVVAQMAIAIVLLVGAGLMVRSFQALRRVDPGFDGATELQTLRLSIPAADVREAEAVVRLHERILRAIEVIPGVESAALTSSVTMDGWDSNDSTDVDGFPTAANELAPSRRYKWISPGYFETMRNPLIAGRTFSWADVYERADVAIITENLALEYWDSPAAAIGQRLRESDESPWRQVVGVVGDIHDDGVARPSRTTVFWPMFMRTFWGEEDFARRSMVYVVRSPRVGDLGFLDEIRRAIWEIDPRLPLANVWTMQELVDRSMARTSFTLVMLAIATIVALVLGTVGVYGVTAYVVSLRTREIGVRMALGAEQRQVRRMVLGHALLLAGLGVALGALAAVGLTRLMTALLYGVSPLDPLAYVAGAAGVVGVALLASYGPARQAAGVDPIEALRG